MPRFTGHLQAADEKAPSRHRWAFYYDGDCAFCTKVVRGLARIDFFNQVQWVPFQTLEEPPTGLTWVDLDRAAYLSTGEGRLHRGFFGFRMLTLRLLPLVPLAPLFWFPGMNLLGVAVYRLIARNRYRISACLPQSPTLGGQGDSLGPSECEATDRPPVAP